MRARFHLRREGGKWVCSDSLPFSNVLFFGVGATPEAAYRDCCFERESFTDPELYK